MTTHVFIVDFVTFQYHLEYMFAGTGAKDSVIDFNNSTNTSLKTPTENTLINMIADVSRVRLGDYVVFYLQQNLGKGIKEGKFYGIFKVESVAFFDNLSHFEKTLNLTRNYNFQYPKNNFKFKINRKRALLKTALTTKEKQKLLDKLRGSSDKRKVENFITRFYQNNQFLLKQLEKSLTFRIKIKPHQVYPEGVTEWEALDDIQNIVSPNQMLWSLIYRKLKGNRGNTMITIYESERLFKLLRDKNNRRKLNGINFTYDFSSQRIISSKTSHTYTGRRELINILPRLIKKYSENKAFEAHLQAYVIQNIGRNRNKSLNKCLLNGTSLEWIGNEVSCGVGMQRIDVMLLLVKENAKIVIAIELKSVEADTSNVVQLQRYIDWLEQYYIPNRISDVQPILIAKKIKHKRQPYWRDITNSFEKFNRINNKCLPLGYIEYELKNNRLEFKEEKY